MEQINPTEKLISALQAALDSSALIKITFSRYDTKDILRAVARLFSKKGETLLQIERFTSDGKALHSNCSLSEASEAVLKEFSLCRQINIITSGGSIEGKRSIKGKLTVTGKLSSAPKIEIASHNRKKTHILYEGTPYDFLIALGVTDDRGNIFEKKRAKFRQIDRFLQYISEIYGKLPKNGDIYVLDLCCGKSYLTFAAYWYLTAIKGRSVKMTGADRKADVIELCSALAARLNYSGLDFICCDITSYTPKHTPSLVLSLHACDIATDIVLTTAARLGAEVILSTPCCHHEVQGQLSSSAPLGAVMKPILEHSLLSQKLAVAITDSLRCKRLQASGYSVDVTELIDPENTPKNLMIRAVKADISEKKRLEYKKQFEELSAALGVSIFGGI